MSYTKQESQTQFNSWSRSYDDSVLQRLLFMPSHRCMLQHMDDCRRSFRLLDIGCGTGAFAQRVAAGYPATEIWAADLSGEMLKRAAARTGTKRPIRFVQADSESLPLADGCFDVVTCANSFHHYPNQTRAVAEMHRVLRPGGRLMIIDGYRDRLWGRFIYDVCVVAVEGAVHHASARRFRELFQQAGFVGVQQQARLGLAPFLLTVGTAAKPSMAVGQTHPPAIAA
jgi:ubiquinone/menaquinone biosynthesis C-methylase UbiE